MAEPHFLDQHSRWLCVVFICVTALLIPLAILSYGFLPNDDALFYAAKVVSGKKWDQILILAPGQNLEYLRFGWNKVLETIHWLFGCGKVTLVQFAVVFQFSFFILLPCYFFTHPEAWLGGLFLLSVCIPKEMVRFLIGRPLTFSITTFVVILLLIGREKSLAERKTFFSCAALVALGTYIHAPWYFLSLLPGFFLAREWQKTGLLFSAILAGIGLGALLCGHPFEFLEEFARVYFKIAQKAENPNFLVYELQPVALNFQVLVLVFLGLFFLRVRNILAWVSVDNPIFFSFAFGAIGGLRTGRFWLDVGVPSLAVWLACQGGLFLASLPEYPRSKKFFVTMICCGLLFVALSADIESRWSARSRAVFLNLENPLHKEWLPEPGGIFASPNMGLFYDTFFSNPRAEWKYILGFDGTLMPDGDFQIWMNMVRNHNKPELPMTFVPWIQKMTATDRFVVKGPVMDKHSLGLEWKYFGDSISVGRKYTELKN